MLVVPLVPQQSANGLAMRAGMLLEALAGRFAVDLILVPVSGPATGTAWASGLARSIQVVEPAHGARARTHTTRQLADPMLRERLARTAPLPLLAAAAPPTLADEVTAPDPSAGAAPPRAVLVMRGYLAPFGLTLARRLGAARAVVDLDDDDEMFALSSGLAEEAQAIARLARAWLPDADLVCAASEQESVAIASRYGLRSVVTLPNSIRRPKPIAPPPGVARLLFVGNLTYGPNHEAARLLISEILPLVRRDYPQATLDLVGRNDGDIEASPGVRITGMVDDLRPFYEGADVAVAPLLRGGGTRIKVLEAFAYGRPVVATTVAAAGLAVTDRLDLLLADSPTAFAAAIAELLADRSRADRLVAHAARTFSDRYAQDVVAPLIRSAVIGSVLEGDPTIGPQSP